jgi:molecular chaperone HscB
VDLKQNFFEVFQLPVAYGIDEQALTARYLDLQRSIHPDRFAAASDRDKRLSVQWTAHVNQAYDTLKTSLSRAIYLLQLKGIDTQANAVVDPAFLLEQISLREDLEDIEQAEDLDRLAETREALETRLTALADDFARSFAATESGGDVTDQGEALQTALQTVYRMQFINKLIIATDQLEERLLDY